MIRIQGHISYAIGRYRMVRCNNFADRERLLSFVLPQDLRVSSYHFRCPLRLLLRRTQLGKCRGSFHRHMVGTTFLTYCLFISQRLCRSLIVRLDLAIWALHLTDKPRVVPVLGYSLHISECCESNHGSSTVTTISQNIVNFIAHLFFTWRIWKCTYLKLYVAS